MGMAAFTENEKSKKQFVVTATRQGDEELLRISRLPRETVLQQFATSMNGLSTAQAKTRQKQYGLNRVGSHRPPGLWHELMTQIRNPLNGLLLFLAVASYFLGDMRAAIVIAAMVVLAVLTAFLQEHRSNQAAQALRAMVHVTASVRRPETSSDSGYEEIALEQLVPGDQIVIG